MILPTGAGKTVHQRHKSSPALSNFINVAAVKALAPKRSAFADVSNARSNQPTKDDVAVNEKAAIVKSKTSQGVESNGKDQPLARKPQRAATLKSSFPTQSQPLVSSTSAHQLSGIPVKSLPSEPLQRHSAVNQKKSSTSKENSEPSIEELLAEHDTASATSLLDEALEKALNGAAIDGELAGVRFPVHVLPSQSSMTNPASNYLPPVSAYPDTHEQAQAALQAVILQEQQQAVQHIPNNTTKSIPLRSQGYYEPEYEATSYEGDYTTHKSIGMVSDTTGGTTLVLAPKYTAKINQEIAAAKEFVDATRTLEDIEDDHWDTSMVTEYGDEIFEYYRTLEVSSVLIGHLLTSN